MSEQVPEGWSLKTIGDFCKESSTKFEGNKYIPVLSVTKYQGFVHSLEYFNKRVFSRDLSSYKVVRKGEFAYATIHLDEGSIGLLDNFEAGLISPMYTVFRLETGLDSIFLFNLMKSDLYLNKYQSLGQGSINRRMSIPFKTLAKLEIPTPPLPEQKEIASVFASVDEVIDNTQKQIDKLQDLKKAVMNELLTKGIGHTKFSKDRELGRVPKSWAVVSLSKMASIDTESLKNTTDANYEFYYIDISSVKTGIIDIPTEKIKFCESPSRARKIVREGDVILSTVRPNLKAFAYVNHCGRKDFICSTGFSVIRATKDNDAKFIFHSILSYGVSKQIDVLVSGSNYPAINSSYVKTLRIARPPLPEQQKIASVLSSIDRSIEEKRKKHQKIQSLKKSLVQDLLTGKVRVHVK